MKKTTRNKIFKNIINLYSDPDVLVELCIKKYIIDKGDTDFMSSIKKINKAIIKEVLEYNSHDDLNELKDDTIFGFKTVFEQTINDSATRSFFSELLENENTNNLVFNKNDLESFYVFVYKSGDDLYYYIPDEIKEIIEDHITSNSKSIA